MAVFLSPIGNFGQYFTTGGLPLNGGFLNTYQAGTTTPQATFTTSAGNIANAVSIQLGVDGRPPAGIWLTSGIAYKYILTDSSGAQVGPPIDNITGIGDGGAIAANLAASSGSSLIGWIQSGAGTVARTMQGKARDLVSIADYTTPAVADANAATLFVPSATTTTLANGGALTANYRGPAQVTTADGNKRGKYFSAIGAAPSALGDENSIETAFNGDWAHSNFSVEHRITGAATLGQPATGYLYRPEAMPFYGFLYNSSGWNQGTADNVGRTGAAFHRVRVYQAGQGDAVAFNGSVFVTGTKAGATHWLANPAGVLFNGDMTAGADGVYLNPYETFCYDGGFDVACVGLVNNFNRTNATGAKSTVWNGYRAQSVGTVACDAFLSGTGKWQTGIDFSMSSLDFGANRAAISLKSNQRIYLNNAAIASGNLGADWRSTVFNGDWMGYDTSISGIIISAGGNPNIQVTSTQVGITTSLKHSGTTLGFFNTTPASKPAVTGSRSAGAALQGLLTALASLGLLTDNTTA